MKYIMIHKQLDKDQAVTYPIIFPNELNHSDVADHIISLLKSHYPSQTVEVVSAGFYNIDNCKSYGHSETLNLESREIDGMHVRLRDYFMFDQIQEPNKRK